MSISICGGSSKPSTRRFRASCSFAGNSGGGSWNNGDPSINGFEDMDYTTAVIDQAALSDNCNDAFICGLPTARHRQPLQSPRQFPRRDEPLPFPAPEDFSALNLGAAGHARIPAIRSMPSLAKQQDVFDRRTHAEQQAGEHLTFCA